MLPCSSQGPWGPENTIQVPLPPVQAWLPTRALPPSKHRPELQEQVDALLADLSALMNPGSRLLFDFMHLPEAPTSSGGGGNGAGASEPPGLASLAAAVANKGCPLRSGLKPSFSGAVQGCRTSLLLLHVSDSISSVSQLTECKHQQQNPISARCCRNPRLCCLQPW